MCLYTSIYRWNGEKCVNGRKENSTNLHHLFTQSQFQTLGTRLELISLSCQSARKAISTALHLPIISPNGQKLVQSLQRRLHMLLPSCTAWFLDTGAHKRSSQIKVGNYATRLLIPLEEWAGFKAQDHQCLSFLQSNGSDERFNQMLKHQLQRLVNDHQDDWDEFLDNVLFAYRSSRQDSMKRTPFLLIHGREAPLLIDLTRRVESLSLSSLVPTTVTKDIRKGRYRLQHHNGNLLKTAINCHHIKICHDPDGGSVSFVCTQCQWPPGCAWSKWGLVLTQFSRH